MWAFMINEQLLKQIFIFIAVTEIRKVEGLRST